MGNDDIASVNIRKTTKESGGVIAFKKQKNDVTYIMNQARREVYTNFIEENSATALTRVDYLRLLRNCLEKVINYLFLTTTIRWWLLPMTSANFS